MTKQIKMVYRGKKKVQLLSPFNRYINPGEEIVVNQQESESLVLANFEYVKEKKQETKKKDKGGNE